jgi:cellulose synthase/poly-beta-1,6-N-acetylglucosamine synthase-like glycosyltransferase
MNSKKTSKSSKPFISVIVPIETKTAYLLETLESYRKQSYKKFEVLIAASYDFNIQYSFAKVIVNKKLSGDVASKRNEIIKHGKGNIFVFNDDDVFVPKNYLKNIVKIFSNRDILAACGPLLTPQNHNFWQQASGAVWESNLGMGGLGGGTHRSLKKPARIVYDFPAANLIIRRDVFKSVGGYEPELYPGEDTKLCLDIYNKYKKGVNYTPKLYVYHYRKPLFKKYLTQIGRYGTQRGWFALSYPETSFKLIYFVPTIFFLYLVFLPLLSLLEIALIIPLFIYAVGILIEGVYITKKKGLAIGVTAALGIITTHLYYGFKFLVSFIGRPVRRIIEMFRLSKSL